MGKELEYKGNDYVDATIINNQINRDEMEKMVLFLKSHDEVYLYGNGMCGNGFMEYCKACDFSNVKGFVTSETIKNYLERYVPKKDGLILALKADYYPEILPMLWGKIEATDILLLYENTKNFFVKTFSKKYLEDHMWITLPLAKHCNVNCASCNMFSPICKKEFYTLKAVKRDIDALKKINVRLSKINITGGEAFLNPEFIDILECIRENYTSLRIEVYTNALLMGKLTEEDLRRISSVSAVFMITDYGLNDECLQKVYESFDLYGINYQVNKDETDKKFFKKVIDFDGKVPNYEYINCQYYTFCFALFLFDGALFKCPMALNLKEINNAFNKDMELTDRDYLRLCDIEKASQIHDFWRSRLPLCSYCPPIEKAVAWKKSERKIEEWT